MKINNKYNILVFIICFMLLGACNTQKRLEKEAIKKQQAVLDKQNERSAERMADYEMLMQQHYDNQSKKTQRMMRKTYKKAEKVKSNKKDSFFVRIFKFEHKTRTKRRRHTK